jgi:hypothetical protein
MHTYKLHDWDKNRHLYYMRSIGMFRASPQGIPIPDASSSLVRNLSTQHVYQNIKPKVGVLSSSERTHARVSHLRTNNHNVNPSDVTSALRRVRNVGPKFVKR